MCGSMPPVGGGAAPAAAALAPTAPPDPNLASLFGPATKPGDPAPAAPAPKDAGVGQLGGGTPGTIASILQNLQQTLQALVSAIGGVAGGGAMPPAKGGGLPASPPPPGTTPGEIPPAPAPNVVFPAGTSFVVDMRNAPGGAGAYSDALTARGYQVTVGRQSSPTNPYFLVKATGYDELVTVDDKQVKFSAQGQYLGVLGQSR
ncbi:MAG: hypothetical protein JWL76_1909 [Thermoleophilia bacterium]|nr:hypothetical protein [Thermoleophilia bacterium]